MILHTIFSKSTEIKNIVKAINNVNFQLLFNTKLEHDVEHAHHKSVSCKIKSDYKVKHKRHFNIISSTYYRYIVIFFWIIKQTCPTSSFRLLIQLMHVSQHIFIIIALEAHDIIFTLTLRGVDSNYYCSYFQFASLLCCTYR